MENDSLFHREILEGLITTLFVELRRVTDSPLLGACMTRTPIFPGSDGCAGLNWRPGRARMQVGSVDPECAGRPAGQTGPKDADLAVERNA